MSSASGTVHSQVQPQQGHRQTSKTEPSNNNNNSAHSSPLAHQAAKMPAKPLTRKRSSVQSNLSSMTNGSGHGSLHSSSSTATSGDDANDDRPNYSNADYERIRNTTLLFFLDRLCLASREGKEARTLHDLSCLFGTKEFSKDMRHIVGASRNGLKKFLQSYPSLFQIDGDKVYLTQLNQGTSSTQRDYNKEAVEYFKMKLLQFGASLVPIKNLFGHRSQANPEVRHVSGKNARDFKRFLKQNEDVFEILAEEHVVLKSALAELESQGQTSLVLEQSLQPLEASDAIVADPYLNKQLAHLVEDCIKSMRQEEIAAARLTEHQRDEFKVNLDILLERIKKHCQNELFLNMVKNQEDLKVFLRMHPKLFKRSKCDEGFECASLLSELERQELELAAKAHQRSLQQRKPSTLDRSISPSSEHQKPVEEANTASDQPQSLVDTRNQQQAPAKRIRQESLTEPQSLPPMPQASYLNTKNNANSSQIGSTVVSLKQQQAQSKASQASQKLRATAPPFVPSNSSGQNSSLTSASRQASANQHSSQQSKVNAPMQRSQSNLSSRTGPDTNEPVRRPLQLSYSNATAPVDQRPAIRNYLMKSNQASHNNINWSQHSRQPESGASMPLKALTDGEMRARTVDIVREASNIISRIMNTTDAVAFDCKGYNLGFDGQITLIQFGFLPTKNVDPFRSLDRNQNHEQQQQQQQQLQQEQKKEQRLKPEVCVFDLITNPELAFCLKPLLESDQIVKIVHDVRNKSNALYVQFQIILNNVFDTQVANLVIQQQETGKPAYKSHYISMGKLCEIYGDEELMKYRNIIKHKTRHSTNGAQASSTSARNLKDANYWRTRPLSKPMIFEATMDVYCLVGGIYQNLKARIKPEYEPLFEQLNREGVLARINPEEIRSAKKERKIDLEVIDLKRKLYADAIGPVVLSNREIRLLRHIDLTEEVRQKIQQCKKVAKKLERLDMKAAELKQEQDGQPLSLTSTSQFSSMAHTVDHLQSIDCASLLNQQQQQHQRSQEEEAFASKMDEFRVTGLITNLMDSSMFDELKDKMIESSSLLESLEDDDDECVSGGHLSSGSHHSHNGSLNHDCCGCQCHRSSIGGGEPAAKSLDKNSAATSHETKSEGSTATSSTAEVQTTTDDGPEESGHPNETRTETSASCVISDQIDAKADEQEAYSDSKSSLACDMAVQCDLLS